MNDLKQTESDIKAASRAIAKFRRIGESRHANKHTDEYVYGVTTAKHYEYTLRNVSAFCRAHGTKLPYITKELAHQYLDMRSTQVRKGQLSNDRRAITLHMKQLHKVQQQVKENKKEFSLDFVPSKVKAIPKTGRAYTAKELVYLTSAMEKELALATKIAYAAGMRVEELLTIKRTEDQPVSKHRVESYEGKQMFSGNRTHWISYTVLGKGGLIREVRLPESLSKELEKRWIAPEQRVAKQNRFFESKITSHYQLIGGVKFTRLFSEAANLHLGYSNGPHGLRHSFAQERLASLQNSGFSHDDAKQIVSLELGHFRDEITKDYLR